MGPPLHTTVYGSQGAGLNYGEDYRVHEARRPSLAVEGGGPRLRRGYSGGPAGGYRKYRSTGNLSGKPHLEEAKILPVIWWWWHWLMINNLEVPFHTSLFWQHYFCLLRCKERDDVPVSKLIHSY